MIHLRPHLEFNPEETALSFASRLALTHTGRGVGQLLRDLGINTTNFISGRRAEVVALADAAGISHDDLVASSVDVRRTHAIFRGEIVSRSCVSPRAARFCPDCLAEDGDRNSWSHRLIWCIRHTQRCARHGLWLNANSDPSAEALHGAVPHAEWSDRREVRDETPEYLVWLEARICGRTQEESSWLATQPIGQVLNASEMIGAVLEHGHDVRVSRLSDEASEQAIDIGFSIYREGPEAVTEALDTIRSASSASAVQAGPLAYYGRIYEWLDKKSNNIEPGPIRDILRAHIVRHFAIEPRTTVLGEEVKTRTAYTFQELSIALGMDRRRLSRLLQKLGKVPVGASDKETGNMTFDVAETLPLIQAFQSSIRLQELPEYLGASKRQVTALCRRGFLEPMVPSSTRGAVRNIAFARAPLDAILCRIEQLPSMTGADENWRTVSAACQRGSLPFEILFPKIMTGYLPARRDPRKHGIGSLLLHAGDIRTVPDAN